MNLLSLNVRNVIDSFRNVQQIILVDVVVQYVVDKGHRMLKRLQQNNS